MRLGGPCLGILVVAVAAACHRTAPPPTAPRAQQEASATTRAPTVAEIVDRARRSVVVIRTNAGLGTGFAVDKNLVATNLHVLIGARAAAVRFTDGRSATTDALAAMDPEHDLALLAFPDASKPFESLPRPFPRAHREGRCSTSTAMSWALRR